MFWCLIPILFIFNQTISIKAENNGEFYITFEVNQKFLGVPLKILFRENGQNSQGSANFHASSWGKKWSQRQAKEGKIQATERTPGKSEGREEGLKRTMQTEENKRMVKASDLFKKIEDSGELKIMSTSPLGGKNRHRRKQYSTFSFYYLMIWWSKYMLLVYIRHKLVPYPNLHKSEMIHTP